MFIDSFVVWDDCDELHDRQKKLIVSLYERKRNQPDAVIYLTDDEKQALYGDIEYCKVALQELSILF